ncbi:transcription initiation at TATA-containing promoter protein, variant 2 [Purpureocillium takamizusanense]|uniref:Transcription initiation at TATA-containing promoter protein, variant 2 n=1 Tax=Purpureocillium takamizusanense TaxID=2060973 RepID=A0A9Q8QB92_9HYPO|nr:transcription initiation at TATA-containing promoter protein, variant 2 [Purpureocillium takamizusanense]UNI16076.1 transcription initiation at TATA-containing promoter protein, variant 2 [Purpureocillium takamizusanense]
MASPGPDAPATEAKSPAPVPAPAASASEQTPQPDVNGHVPSEEPTTKPQPDLAVPSAAEHPAEKDVPSPSPAESPQPEAERPLLNGNGSTGEHTEANKPAADADAKPAQPESSAASKSPAPKPAESPAPAPVEDLPKAVADEEAPKAADPGPKVSSPQAPDEPAAAPLPAASEDVEMADSAPVKDERAEPASQAADDKSAPASPVAKEPAPDTEMTDSRVEDPATAKPEHVDEPIPSQDAAALPSSEVDLGPARMSQLAIETDDKDTSLDVSMTEAPSTKVAREREEDTTEEPAPKRARTEPKEDEPADKETSAAPADATGDVINAAPDVPLLDMTAVTSLTRWTDADTNAATITPFQRREIRKVIGRVKKTKSGGHFRDSVQKLWPQVWEGYAARIEKPMDLSEVDRSVRDPNSLIATWGDFKSTLALIFENAMDFNGPDHTITAAAAHAVKLVWEDVVTIPAEEPVKPKAVPKPKPVRESRTVSNADAVARRQSAGPAGSPDAPAPAAPTQEAPVDRRSSTATDGDRPKRTVRAPKPKDIDYTTKPSRKKLKPELQFCDEVLTELMSPKHHNINKWFTEPVDAEGLGIPSYYSVIKKPMDLGKVQRMLAGGDISSFKEFDKNVRLVFENCYKFNGPPEQGNPVSGLAAQLEDLYVGQVKNKDSWLAKHAKSNAPAATASNASDEDEDEDEGDDNAAQAAAAANKDMEELKARLDEETQKLNGLLLSGNQSIITMQQQIVQTVQTLVIEAAQKAQQARVKPEKPAKKTKAGKPKAAGGAGRKSTGGGGDKPKKAAGSKKAASRKDLSPDEKNQIANAINDLDSPHLDQAIDIIKHDTGQNVSGYVPLMWAELGY